ncbi:hypothetical protein SLEP1_g19501 [Rubroshorea leprosula]|uniref:Uncharacterized protein n=1 Tax=Rubroshorea leprosula TaxID=152421 RepID=A0AAV5JBF8_9ROSI|nr:hypothetical protein SLEP1_g19501 [Rubroshorea leprosula]
MDGCLWGMLDLDLGVYLLLLIMSNLSTHRQDVMSLLP